MEFMKGRMRSKKILFLGPPEAGKTSLRKFFFDATPADTLLEFSEPPTINLKFNLYDYLYSYPLEDATEPTKEKIPIKLAIVDTSGQEIHKWMDEQKDRVFPDSDVIIFIFDVNDWYDNDAREYVKDLYKQTCENREVLAPESRLCIFAHKIDNLTGKGINFDDLSKEIKNELIEYAFKDSGRLSTPDIYLTSIKKEYRGDCFLILLELTTDLFSHLL